MLGLHFSENHTQWVTRKNVYLVSLPYTLCIISKNLQGIMACAMDIYDKLKAVAVGARGAFYQSWPRMFRDPISLPSCGSA